MKCFVYSKKNEKHIQTPNLMLLGEYLFLECDAFKYLTCLLSLKFISELAFSSDLNYVFIFLGKL